MKMRNIFNIRKEFLLQLTHIDSKIRYIEWDKKVIYQFLKKPNLLSYNKTLQEFQNQLLDMIIMIKIKNKNDLWRLKYKFFITKKI